MAYKDGFVIEYANQGARINCYKCTYFNKRDKDCRKTGVYVPDVARVKWKTCPHFALSIDFDTDEMREKAARIQLGAQGQKAAGKKGSKKKDAASAGGRGVGGRGQKKYGDRKGGAAQRIVAPESSLGFIAGRKAYSPAFGKGKIVDVDGHWITVLFKGGSKRMRFNAEIALMKESLELDLEPWELEKLFSLMQKEEQKTARKKGQEDRTEGSEGEEEIELEAIAGSAEEQSAEARTDSQGHKHNNAQRRADSLGSRQPERRDSAKARRAEEEAVKAQKQDKREFGSRQHPMCLHALQFCTSRLLRLIAPRKMTLVKAA